MSTPFLHAFTPPARSTFVSIVRGSGASVWDADGNEYLDAMASLWYCAVGHGRREIADAVHRQMLELEAYSTFEPFSNPRADELAERLVELTPVPDARVFLCSSGSEAIDTAIKLARLHHVLAGQPERTLVVSRQRGYHGTNLGGTSAQGIPANRSGFGPLAPEFVTVASDDLDELTALMTERGGQVAAVITEPVQGAGGVHPPTAGYLAGLRRLCDQHGALLVLDEVITGFGRMGTWFAAEHYEVTPDLSTFAKAVTSGYQPLGGVIVGARVRRALESDASFTLRHGYTYSGHPSACAAALENLDVIERERLLGAAGRIAARLGDGLRTLATDGLVAEVRGAAGVWGVTLWPGLDAMSVRDRLLERGVITRAIGTDTCAFCPPLVTSDEQLDRIVEALTSTLVEQTSTRPTLEGTRR